MRGRLLRALALPAAAAVLAAVLVGGGAARNLAGPVVAMLDPAPESIVFAAYVRDSQGKIAGNQALYTARIDGAGLKQISPADGRFYDWPSWALNGSAIVYSAGSPTSTAQSLYLAQPDGSNPVQLVGAPWMNAQPKVSPDGRSLVFSSEWPEYQRVGIYHLDLGSLLVDNLSARSYGAGLDGDPRYSADGSRVVFASSFSDKGPTNTQIWVMNADGTGRQRLTHDSFFDTDPALSPDGRYVVYSSYQGSDQPIPGQPNNGFTFSVADWHIMLVDLKTGVQRSLTGGQNCTTADPAKPCSPTQGSGWVPVWSPDGTRIGFQSVRSPILSGLYSVDLEGGDPRTILEGPKFAIGYWDWSKPKAPPAGAQAAIGKTPPKDRLLFGGSVFDGAAIPPPQIFAGTPDRWNPDRILPERRDLAPTFARWFPDRKHIVFTARVAYDASHPDYEPKPPPGQTRHEHFTFDMLGTAFVAPEQPQNIAEEQVFVMDADGSHVRQLTTPWTEDYLDAIQSGDVRANIEPDVSPDGRYVIFTNVSTLRYETFILRLDLQTGQVVNLTNVTSGAVPVADAQAVYSPDGQTIALSSAVGGDGRIYLMNADGTNYRLVTDDDHYNAFPAWSPDGRSLVYSSFRGGGLPLVETDALAEAVATNQLRLDSWFLVKLDVTTGTQTVLTSAADSPPLRPVWSPDGLHIAYITVGKTLAPDIYVIPAAGGPPVPLQLTILTKEEYVDWR